MSTGTGPTSEPRRKSRRARVWVLRAVAGTGLLPVILLNGCGGWLARSLVWGPNTGKTVDPAGDASPETLAKIGVDRQLRVEVGPPAASISLWVLDPAGSSETGPRGTVLVLHGINDKKSTMLGVGRQLAGRGYRAVLVDLRAHGRSSGEWLTFGVVESRDLSQVLDALAARDLLAGRVGVFGPSFGGGVAIQFAGRDPRVRAAVSVCGFTSMRDVTPRVVRMYTPIVGWFLLDSTVQKAVTESGRIAGFDPDQASPLDAIRRTDARVLLIHGREDKKIPPSHSERLHAAAADHSRLLLLDHEGHDSILAGDAGGNVMRETLGWFDEWLR